MASENLIYPSICFLTLRWQKLCRIYAINLRIIVFKNKQTFFSEKYRKIVSMWFKLWCTDFWHFYLLSFGCYLNHLILVSSVLFSQSHRYHVKDNVNIFMHYLTSKADAVYYCNGRLHIGESAAFKCFLRCEEGILLAFVVFWVNLLL